MSEMRGLLKKCFSSANPFFLLSFIPFEIWRDNIISKADDRGVICISQTCKGFKWLVDNLRERLLEHALKYRRDDQIPQARDTILRCAAIGNSRYKFQKILKFTFVCVEQCFISDLLVGTVEDGDSNQML